MVATVTAITSASATVHYFEQDGYYAKNDPEHRRASFWHGAAARDLALGRHVKPKTFESILAGYVPGTDIRLGRARTASTSTARVSTSRSRPRSRSRSRPLSWATNG